MNFVIRKKRPRRLATALSLVYHLPRRSGRSPALPYPPSRRIDFIKVAGTRQEDFVDTARRYFSTAAASADNLRRSRASISLGVGPAGVGTSASLLHSFSMNSTPSSTAFRSSSVNGIF